MALPGATGVLIVTRAIEGRFAEARKIGFGAAIPEAVYAGIAFAGSSSLLDAHPAAVPIMRGLTCIVLLVIGVTFVRWKPTDPSLVTDEKRPGAFRIGLLTAALNPVLLISWGTTAGMLTSFGLITTSGALAVPFGLGIIFGSNAWYAILLALMTRYHARLPRRFFTWLIRGIGAFLVASGLWTAFNLVKNLLH